MQEQVEHVAKIVFEPEQHAAAGAGPPRYCLRFLDAAEQRVDVALRSDVYVNGQDLLAGVNVQLAQFLTELTENNDIRLACDHCTKRKRGCTGKALHPCKQCVQRSIPCVYSIKRTQQRASLNAGGSGGTAAERPPSSSSVAAAAAAAAAAAMPPKSHALRSSTSCSMPPASKLPARTLGPRSSSWGSRASTAALHMRGGGGGLGGRGALSQTTAVTAAVSSSSGCGSSGGGSAPHSMSSTPTHMDMLPDWPCTEQVLELMRQAERRSCDNGPVITVPFSPRSTGSGSGIGGGSGMGSAGAPTPRPTAPCALCGRGGSGSGSSGGWMSAVPHQETQHVLLSHYDSRDAGGGDGSVAAPAKRMRLSVSDAIEQQQGGPVGMAENACVNAFLRNVSAFLPIIGEGPLRRAMVRMMAAPRANASVNALEASSFWAVVALGALLDSAADERVRYYARLSFGAAARSAAAAAAQDAAGGAEAAAETCALCGSGGRDAAAAAEPPHRAAALFNAVLQAQNLLLRAYVHDCLGDAAAFMATGADALRMWEEITAGGGDKELLLRECGGGSGSGGGGDADMQGMACAMRYLQYTAVLQRTPVPAALGSAAANNGCGSSGGSAGGSSSSGADLAALLRCQSAAPCNTAHFLVLLEQALGANAQALLASADDASDALAHSLAAVHAALLRVGAALEELPHGGGVLQRVAYLGWLALVKLLLSDNLGWHAAVDRFIAALAAAPGVLRWSHSAHRMELLALILMHRNQTALYERLRGVHMSAAATCGRAALLPAHACVPARDACAHALCRDILRRAGVFSMREAAEGAAPPTVLHSAAAAARTAAAAAAASLKTEEEAASAEYAAADVGMASVPDLDRHDSLLPQLELLQQRKIVVTAHEWANVQHLLPPPLLPLSPPPPQQQQQQLAAGCAQWQSDVHDMRMHPGRGGASGGGDYFALRAARASSRGGAYAYASGGCSGDGDDDDDDDEGGGSVVWSDGRGIFSHSDGGIAAVCSVSTSAALCSLSAVVAAPHGLSACCAPSVGPVPDMVEAGLSVYNHRAAADSDVHGAELDGHFDHALLDELVTLDDLLGAA